LTCVSGTGRIKLIVGYFRLVRRGESVGMQQISLR